MVVFRIGAALRRGVRVCLLGTWVGLLALASFAGAAEPVIYHNGGYAFSVAPPAAWIEQHDIPVSWDPAAPGVSGASWRNWLFDTQVDRRAGARERYFDIAYEPVSSEQVPNAGKHQIWFSPDYERLTIHRVEVRRDGTWHNRLAPASITLARRETEFERDMATGAVSAMIVLDDVRSGDIVRISYTVSGMNPVLAGLVDEEFRLGFLDPLLDRHARILFDAGVKLAEHADPGAPATTQKRDRAKLEWRADQHGLARMIDEGSYPVWYPQVPRIVVGVERDWGAIAAWARSLYPAPQALPADLEQKIGEWSRLATPDERISAALRAVQEDVRYFAAELGENTHRPAEPAETWTRRYGDCKDKARLLATVLGRLGVEAHPAMVSASDGKYVEQLPPAASLFDHVIVQAKLADTTLWLDATRTQQRGSPRQLVPGQFGVALPIAPDARGLVAVTPPSTAVDRVKIATKVVPVLPGTAARLEIESGYEGAAADRMRYWLTSRGEEEVDRKMRDFYGARYGEIATAGKPDLRDDASVNRLVVKQTYTLKNPWISGEVGQRMIEAYSDDIGSYLTLPNTNERHAPLAVSFPADVEETFEVVLPEGWHAVSTPMQRSIEDPAMALDYRTDVSARSITTTQHYRARRDVVEPQEFPKHLAALREANELVGRRIVMGASPRDAERERDKRLENVMRNLLDDSKKAPEQGGHR